MQAALIWHDLWLSPHHLIGREVQGVVIKDTDLKWAFCLLTDYYSLGKSCGWDHWAVRARFSVAAAFFSKHTQYIYTKESTCPYIQEIILIIVLQQTSFNVSNSRKDYGEDCERDAFSDTPMLEGSSSAQLKLARMSRSWVSGPVRGSEVLLTVYSHVQRCLSPHPQPTLFTTFAPSSLAALGLIPCPGAETTGSQPQH